MGIPTNEELRAEARRLMEENPALSIDDVAEELGVSSRQLQRILKEKEARSSAPSASGSESQRKEILAAAPSAVAPCCSSGGCKEKQKPLIVLEDLASEIAPANEAAPAKKSSCCGPSGSCKEKKPLLALEVFPDEKCLKLSCCTKGGGCKKEQAGLENILQDRKKTVAFCEEEGSISCNGPGVDLETPSKEGKKDACCSSASCGVRSVAAEAESNPIIGMGSDSTCYKMSVQGMDCAGCANMVEEKLLALPGVSSVKLSFLTGTGWVICSGPVPEELILKSVQNLGYTIQIQLQQAEQAGNPAARSESVLQLSLRDIGNSSASTFETLLRDKFGDAVKRCTLAIVDPVGQSTTSWSLLALLRNFCKPRSKMRSDPDRELLLSQDSLTDIEAALKSTSSKGEPLKDGILTIEYDASRTGARKLLSIIHEAGYSAELASDQPTDAVAGHAAQQQYEVFKHSLILSWMLLTPTVIITWVLTFNPVNGWLDFNLSGTFTVRALLEWTLATVAQVWVGRPLYVSAYRALRYMRTANMDTLVVLSTSTAYIYSVVASFLAIFTSFEGETFFDTCVVLLALVMLGRFLESKSQQQASSILYEILLLQPSTALLVPDYSSHGTAAEAQEVAVSLLEHDDIVKVPPGARIPADGTVIDGNSSVDESSLTGESVPVEKQLGNSVFAGTVNQHGVLHVQVTHTASESTVETLRKAVEEAQMSKAPIQGQADKIASYFVPSIIALSVVMFFVWFGLARGGVIETGSLPAVPFALIFALTILVISCPCAISLAVPTAIMVACGVGAKLGILFKGGEVIDRCRRVNAVVFDKTGTLTSGKLSVKHVQLIGDRFSPREFWTLLASGEANSEHVIAKGLVSYAQEKIAGLHVLSTTDFEITPGLGLSCIVGDGKQVAIGNRQWILQNVNDGNRAIDPTYDRMAAEMEVRGHTVIWMAVNGSLAGFVAMSDTIRPEAVATVQALLDRGYNVWLLSGDNVNTCRAVAQDLGLDPDRVIGGVLPGGKREIIQQLQGQSVSSSATPLKNVPAGCVVAMVGDGINDSPALSQADVGIAIGSGTDIAVESAQVVLLKDQLWDVVIALDLARKTFQVIRSNFLWAFLYNVIGIPLASGFLFPFTGFVVPPAVAGASEMLSSLPVVLFSLALKLYRPPTLKITGIRT